MDGTALLGERRRDVTSLLLGRGGGETNAAARIFPLVYDDLRNLAATYLRRERCGHTLQPTALVHESFCRLVDSERCDARNRAPFLAPAARAMRRVLVEHARKRGAAKRGGRVAPLSLEQVSEISVNRSAYLVALDEALADLALLDERQARIVELRFFGGLSIEETAEVISVSHATVEREWRVAKAWLHRAVTDLDES
ncbi:MAG: sigma-70 family RNA polymerase sigma factor [Planctomycetes bacterium]|nr:sigma-70 family RNA polymerase sigma factor [Planctomycetota bacterium]